MRSDTNALWPLLLEKAWIAFMGGSDYGDICANEKSDFSAAAAKRITAHAGCVVQVLTGIMFDMHTIESRSSNQIWEDINAAVKEGAPCFAGTFGQDRVYEELEDELQIKLYANHCYVVCQSWEKEGERYLRLRNPHNRLAGESRQSSVADEATLLQKAGTLVAKPKVHRMNTMTALDSALLHGQEFDCTVDQFGKYFRTYEVSRRGTASLLDKAKSVVQFAGGAWDEIGGASQMV